MDEQDHVEINLDPIATKAEEPEIQVVKAEENPEPPKKKLRNEVSPEDGIQELRAKLDQERQARVDAERRAQEAANREFQAKNEVQDTNLHLVTNAIDTVRRENDMLTSSYAEAMGSGDYDRASKIQRAMATNEARLLQLENGKAAMESQPKQAPPKPQYADHVEALASQVTPASASWLRQHRDHLGTQKSIDRMFRAHADAIDDGIIPDTRDYFEFIETRMGINRSEPREESYDAMNEAAKPTQRRQAPPSAPVTRSGTAPGTRPNVVRLSAQEREMAEMMQMTETEYARNKLALQKEGKLN